MQPGAWQPETSGSRRPFAAGRRRVSGVTLMDTPDVYLETGGRGRNNWGCWGCFLSKLKGGWRKTNSPPVIDRLRPHL